MSTPSTNPIHPHFITEGAAALRSLLITDDKPRLDVATLDFPTITRSFLQRLNLLTQWAICYRDGVPDIDTLTTSANDLSLDRAAERAGSFIGARLTSDTWVPLGDQAD